MIKAKTTKIKMIKIKMGKPRLHPLQAQMPHRHRHLENPINANPIIRVRMVEDVS